MIVRVMGEGQYRVDGGLVSRFEETDQHLLAAVHRGDDAAYHMHLREVLDLVRQGVSVPIGELVSSDLIVPGSDMTLRDARRILEEHPE
jgi:hypothetical protein